VTPDCRSAFEVLREHGLGYDSSILPLRAGRSRVAQALRAGKRYGIADASRFAA
jgi:hypothetical protein